jgi:V8-like Glu-specific endopeptidase
MRLRPRRAAALSATAAAAVALSIALSVMLSPAALPAVSATAAASGQASTVGALFTLTRDGELGDHFCTGSVVDSPGGDLILTAAHCVSQSSVGTVVFVPGYGSGKGSFGNWTVTRVIVDAKWSSSRDPDDDFAFLVVGQAGATTPIEDLTGGEVIGIDEPAGRAVEVAGYPNGLGQPISCENTALSFSPTQYQFNCDGFTDGTSGSPLLAGGIAAGGADTVIGVIGGYQKGGATASVSYAARFSTNLAGLYRQALQQSGA